jgi:predicted 3-demethylubiquinone-9 3-methyltransferase (glyoxalase superfamily)
LRRDRFGVKKIDVGVAQKNDFRAIAAALRERIRRPGRCGWWRWGVRLGVAGDDRFGLSWQISDVDHADEALIIGHGKR